MKLNRRFTGWRCAGVLATKQISAACLSVRLLARARAGVPRRSSDASSVPSVSRWAVRVFAVVTVVYPAAGIWASRRRSIGG